MFSFIVGLCDIVPLLFLLAGVSMPIPRELVMVLIKVCLCFCKLLILNLCLMVGKDTSNYA